MKPTGGRNLPPVFLITMMKLAIFDMDGTILDSMWMWRTVLPRFLETLNIPNSKVINDKVAQMSFTEAMNHVTAHYDIGMTAEALYGALESYILYLYENEIEIKPYVRTYLEQLSTQGVKICLATLTERHMVNAVLKRLDILKYFDYIFTVSEIGKSKEYPDIYETCLKETGIEKKDAVVFEDAAYCLKTAHNAGFVCYGIADPWQEFPAGFIDAHCDRFIRSYAELLKFDQKSHKIVL